MADRYEEIARAPKPLPARDEVIALLDYNPETGIFRWKSMDIRHKRLVGAEAGRLHANGYREIYLGKRLVKAHRLAWPIVHEVDPGDKLIDHINRVRSDNRIANLRLASGKENVANRTPRRTSKSGYRGVHFSAREKRYIAKIRRNGRSDTLGMFSTAAEASATYEKAASEYFGDRLSPLPPPPQSVRQDASPSPDAGATPLSAGDGNG
jgi:hypothetical protein